jgi:hypothetical protein
MTMGGKRFGLGLAAGLLLGLAVVTASGGLGSTLSPSYFGSFRSGNQAVSSVTTTMTAVTILSSTAASSSNYTPGYPISSLNSSSGSVTSVTTTSTTPGSAAQNANNIAATPSFSSHLDSIAAQPFLSNVVILVPVVLALVLGAVLYLSSARSRREPAEEQS